MNEVALNARVQRPAHSEQGFALLIVLWSVTLLALLAMRLNAIGRSELQVAMNIRNAAVAEAQADGIVFGAIVRLMRDTPEERGVDGLVHAADVAGGRATIRVASLAGKVNPNVASEDMLRALIQQVGAAPKLAASLAAAIADWRNPGQTPRPGGAKAAQYVSAGLAYTPPGAPFQSVGEVGLVLGMPPELFSRLAPHLTVFYPGDPVWSAADPVVAQAMQSQDLVNIHTPPEGEDTDADYVEITVRVSRRLSATFTRKATAWVGHGLFRGRYGILRWDTVDD